MQSEKLLTKISSELVLVCNFFRNNCIAYDLLYTSMYRRPKREKTGGQGKLVLGATCLSYFILFYVDHFTGTVAR